MMTAMDYNEAEHWLSTRKALEKYQLHWTKHNFKTSLKTPQPERPLQTAHCATPTDGPTEVTPDFSRKAGPVYQETSSHLHPSCGVLDVK